MRIDKEQHVLYGAFRTYFKGNHKDALESRLQRIIHFDGALDGEINGCPSSKGPRPGPALTLAWIGPGIFPWPV